MVIDEEKLNLIYNYVGDDNFSFLSGNMVGKTLTQLNYIARYALEHNNQKIVVFINNRNTIHRLFSCISDLISDTEEKHLLCLHLSEQLIRINNNIILIISDSEKFTSLMKKDRMNLILIDDFGYNLRGYKLEDLCWNLRYIHDTKIIINGDTSEKTLNMYSIIDQYFNFKEISDIFYNSSVYSRVFKIKKLLEIKKG